MKLQYYKYIVAALFLQVNSYRIINSATHSVAKNRNTLLRAQHGTSSVRRRKRIKLSDVDRAATAHSTQRTSVQSSDLIVLHTCAARMQLRPAAPSSSARCGANRSFCLRFGSAPAGHHSTTRIKCNRMRRCYALISPAVCGHRLVDCITLLLNLFGASIFWGIQTIRPLTA